MVKPSLDGARGTRSALSAAAGAGGAPRGGTAHDLRASRTGGPRPGTGAAGRRRRHHRCETLRACRAVLVEGPQARRSVLADATTTGRV
ncbi:hypothetical protein HBB16_11945 [Pseudonocardia sp. MCCB 268]|nr:hypothetical protein [Pseudonocardia cytotoxica]